MIDRFAILIHHITTLAEPSKLGRTKLAKILWLADVEYFRQTGNTISGTDDYVKDEFGPRHERLYETIQALERDRRVVCRQALTPVGPRYEVVPLTRPDVNDFTAEEIAIVDRITARVIDLSATAASDLTHDEFWESAFFNERMPVAAAAPIAGESTPEIEQWADDAFHADSSSS
jgi:hypothetical protein